MKKVLHLYLVISLTLILVTIVLVFRLPEDKLTHNHANFGVFLNDQKLDFSSAKFMHIKPCVSEGIELKSFGDRVHLHDAVGDVAHIHDTGVTWGDLMLYLGVKTTINGLEFDGKFYPTTKNNQLNYFINGGRVNNFEQSEINNNDSLMVVLGDENASNNTIGKEKLNQLSSRLSNRSEELNKSTSIESCGGSYKIGFWNKVAKVWGF